jgi:serine/threonine protein kinase
MDIKPANILISIRSRNSSIRLFMTDVRILRIIRDPEQSQTDGATGRTEMHCSPEVTDGEPRGCASDIFSLGCVFAETLTCIAGQTVQEFRNHRTDSGVSFHSNLSLVFKWMEDLDFEEGASISPAACQFSTVCRKTTLGMINRDPNKRPTAWQLLEIFPPRPCCK